MRAWLITGVSSGLGRALAQAVLEAGDAVAGTVRRDADKAAFEALAPGRAFGVIADLRSFSAAEAVAQAEAAAGPLDVLVNNAGYGLAGAVEEASAEELRQQFEVNTFAPIALIQAVLPGMRARRAGRIINVTSVSGIAVWVGTGLYCASKAALESAGESLAQEVAPLGIKVTNIEPGGLRTDYGTRSLAEAGTVIADYDSTAGLTRRIIADHAGHEPGDPARAAQAILRVSLDDAPPLRVVLGADALGYFAAKVSALQDTLSLSRDPAWAIAFDQGPAA